jgi:outer membrane protein assembly factor BamB
MLLSLSVTQKVLRKPSTGTAPVQKQPVQKQSVQHKYYIVSVLLLVIQSAVLWRSGSVSLGGDWPGHLGVNRDGIASGSKAIPELADSIVAIAWELPAGAGYAGASIAGKQVCLFDRDGADDRVRMVSLESGKLIWEARLPANYRGGVDSDRGPRCVPTILDTKIVIYSAAGDLSVIDRKKGSIIWTRPLRKELQADDGYFGAGSTPLVFEDLIIVNVGGKDSGVVAVSLANGQTVWKTGEFEASYASPIGISVSGQIRILVPTRLKTILLNPSDGSLLSEIRFGARGPTVNAATPIPMDKDRVFLTASYGIGTLIVDTSTGKLVEVDRNELVSSQYATPVHSDGFLFASDGREDGGESSYVCIDARKLKTIWSHPNMPIAHSILVGNKVLVVGIDGRIWAIRSDAVAWAPLWSLQLPVGNYRALPALADGFLVTRTVDAGGKWRAIRLD